ncbi:hypothetical protein HanIR_Chr09g0405421 [Helianthus annuus]|nr:hypothetical protein HanIR_Chr09g0405421 [Helianthus annuus]
MVIKDMNYGAEPFRVFSSWLNRPEFAQLVVLALFDFSVEGPPDLYLIHKLRFLRYKIKEWRDGLRRKEGEEEEKARLELENLEVEMEYRDLTEEEEWVRLECKKRLLVAEFNKAKDLKQRSRVRWAMDGEDNTKFFHGLINKRKASNAILGLLENDVLVSKPRKVKRMVYNFFREKFMEDLPNRPELNCSFDGFNMKFFKRFWDLFEEDFVNIFKYFFEMGCFS